ncbi:MAG: AI-2E family transporter [Chloroflexota bacterium]|nr:AI-2E family transporter [Chloroflexota bacterium]
MLPPSAALGLAPRERRWLLAFLILGSGYFGFLLAERVVAFLGGFSSILLIVFLAWLLAFVISPLVRTLNERVGLPRGISAAIAYLVALIALGFVLFSLGAAITAQVGELTRTFPQTATRIEETLGSWQRSLDLERFGIDLVGIFASAQAGVGSLAGSALAQAQAIVGATIGAVGSFILILILSLYMVVDSDRILNRLNRIVPNRYKDELRIFEATVARAFGGFLRAQLIMMALQWLLVAIVWIVFGVPYVFLIATLSALAMFIPIFGPPLALVPPIAAAWIYASSDFLVITILLVVVQTVAVNWLQPRLMHGALGMHPILVLVGLLIGAQVAGVWGALFGIPVIAVLNVFLNYFLWSEVPNVALPEDERLEDVAEATMVKVQKQQVSDETHPHIHVHRSVRQGSGEEQVDLIIDEEPAEGDAGS